MAHRHEGASPAGERPGKLAVLLDYWLEHSREHGQEFRRWAGRPEAATVSRELRLAAAALDRAVRYLKQAREHLQEEEEG